ncbi:Nuclear receptor corepressor 2 like [Actinidia chinensis var. chinensis]|uniref:Nuclear receptor corepressor 2 like n=1 Tax=Actinidia chinensis var. chinensis TaxID=1590841 RepID=A0A2R6Q026_ACTCC|nr:Nuclear receptor corepressor 2 like [Actinidia chinensis var. chinensis]
MMITSFSLLILQTLITSITAHPILNISHFIYPKISDELRPQPSPFLEDVLKAISVREGWNNSGDVRVSKLDSRNAKYGGSQRYEFRIRIGKIELIFKLRDEVSSWKKMKKGGDFESVVNAVSSMAVLDAFRVEGPLELRVGGDDELSLLLPLNASHIGLKRILVGEGITVELRNAQGVSLDHALELASQVNRSVAIDQHGSEFWPFQNSLCETLLPIHISGSATVAAYRARNPDSYIETAFLLRDAIELLPEKCYLRNVYRKRRCPIDSINSRTAAIEKLLRSFLGDKIRQNGGLGFLKANIKASTVVRFKMELERDIRRNDTLQDMLAEWRTRPSVERAWFEVVARIEGKRLKPLVVKKVRPFIEVDSSAWSNLMSNISFTKFPSVLVPPDALTLDVKW